MKNKKTKYHTVEKFQYPIVGRRSRDRILV